MTHHTISGMEEAAGFLLDTLVDGKDVTLDIAAEGPSQQGLLRLITALHDVATTRRLCISLRAVGERGIQLSLAQPT